MLATIGTDLFRNWSKSGFTALEGRLPARGETIGAVSPSLGARALVWNVKWTISYDYIRRYIYFGDSASIILFSAGAHEFVVVRPPAVFVAWSDVRTDFVVVHVWINRAWIIRRGELRSVKTQNAVLDIHPLWVTRLGGVPKSITSRRLLEVFNRAAFAVWRCDAFWRLLACRRNA